MHFNVAQIILDLRFDLFCWLGNLTVFFFFLILFFSSYGIITKYLWGPWHRWWMCFHFFLLVRRFGRQSTSGSVSWSPNLILSGISKGYSGDIWLLLGLFPFPWGSWRKLTLPLEGLQRSSHPAPLCSDWQDLQLPEFH